jgi:hypothetical protein
MNNTELENSFDEINNVDFTFTSLQIIDAVDQHMRIINADTILQSLNNVFNSLDGNTWQQKLDNLSSCDCCERHARDRPVYFQPWIDTTFTNSRENDNVCKCKCRHTARYICRQCNDDVLLARQPSPISIINS